MNTLQDLYEEIQRVIQADANMSDAEKYELMFGEPYTYKNPWEEAKRNVDKQKNSS